MIVGDPPLTPSQLQFWREKMCLSVGVRHTAAIVIRRHTKTDAWMVGAHEVSKSIAEFLMGRARRVRP